MKRKRVTLEKTIGVSNIVENKNIERRRESIFITININCKDFDVFYQGLYKNSLKKILVDIYIELFIRDKKFEEDAEKLGYFD